MFFLVLNFLFGCQSYRSAMGIICNAPASCQQCMQSSEEQRMTMLARHIDQRLKNDEARQLLDDLSVRTPEERAKILEAESKKHGLNKCPIAAEMEE